MDPGILRIIDANANRAREGLRVLEEHARFVLADALLTERVKACRHRLRAVLDAWPAAWLAAERDAILARVTAMRDVIEDQADGPLHGNKQQLLDDIATLESVLRR